MTCNKVRPEQGDMERVPMLCYHCLADEREETAVAICRRCGAAACGAHVRELRHPRVPIGLYGPVSSPRELVCLVCLDALAGAVPVPERRRCGALARIEPAPLPDTSAAIQYAETFLAAQRSTRSASTTRVTRRSRRFVVQQWLARHVPLLLILLGIPVPAQQCSPDIADRAEQ